MLLYNINPKAQSEASNIISDKWTISLDCGGRRLAGDSHMDRQLASAGH